MNTEMAKSMRNAISKLKALDEKIGASQQSVVGRQTSLSQGAMTAACLADADFGKVYKAVEPWL